MILVWWPTCYYGTMLRGIYTKQVGLQPWPLLPYALGGVLLFGVSTV